MKRGVRNAVFLDLRCELRRQFGAGYDPSGLEAESRINGNLWVVTLRLTGDARPLNPSFRENAPWWNPSLFEYRGRARRGEDPAGLAREVTDRARELFARFTTEMPRTATFRDQL